MSSKTSVPKTSKKLDFHSKYRCRICKKSYKKFIIFEGHFAFNAKCRARYGWLLQCYICTKTYSHLAVLKYHLGRHHINKNNDFKPNGSQSINRTTCDQNRDSPIGLKCNICNRNFRTTFYLKEHMVTHSKKAINKIPENDQVNGNTSSKKILHAAESSFYHRENGNNIRPEQQTISKLNCESCKLPFTTEVSLKFHRKLFHPYVDQPKENDNTCEICNAKFSFSENLARHMNVHVIGEVQCKVCLIRFTKQSLEIHTKEAHPELTDHEVVNDVSQKRNRNEGSKSSDNDQPAETVHKLGAIKESPFQCNICKKVFNCHSHVVIHESTHKGEFKCNICQFPFTRKALETHNKRFHADDDSDQQISSYQCKICSLAFKSYSEIVRHKAIHKGEFKSNKCQIPSTKKALDSHNNRVHSDQQKSSYPCKSCRKVFKSYSEIVRHEAIHRGDFECDICQIPFTKKALESHYNRVHSDQPKPSYQCQLCKKQFDSNTQLVRHKMSHNGAFKCEICKIPFTENALVAHNSRYHTNQRTKLIETTTQNSHQCKICKRKFHSRSRLTLHSGTHKAALECEICKLPFTMYALKIHKFRHHLNMGPSNDDLQLGGEKVNYQKIAGTKRLFNCKVCKKVFDRRSHLKRHEPSHRGKLKEKNKKNSQFECDLCGKVCNIASNLEQHKMIHTFGECICEFCNVRFSASTLKPHQISCRRRENQNVVTPEPSKPEKVTSKISYNCDKCEKSFTRNCYLQIHLKSHRQYSCNICDKPCNGRAHLRDHYKSHSFECYVCKLECASTKTLSTHIKRHIVYEKWVDPLNVYLSNWSPEKSREILENQPLVLVENLDINTVNLNFSVACDKPNEVDSENVSSEIYPDTSIECSEVAPIIEKMEPTNETDVLIDMNSETQSVNECVASYRKNIELKYSEQFVPQSIFDNNDEEHQDPANIIVNIPVPSDDEEIVVKLPDSTSIYNDDIESVIDVSSESDVDDILELHHCYFCNETYRSLHALGIHVKKCRLCP